MKSSVEGEDEGEGRRRGIPALAACVGLERNWEAVEPGTRQTRGISRDKVRDSSSVFLYPLLIGSLDSLPVVFLRPLSIF